jgi:hypothetical protein
MAQFLFEEQRSMPNRFVYYFGHGEADGGKEDKPRCSAARARTWRR